MIPPLSMQYDAFYEGAFGAIQNYLIAQNQANMAACATSSAYAFAGTTPADMTANLQSMFASIPHQKPVRLTQ